MLMAIRLATIIRGIGTADAGGPSRIYYLSGWRAPWGNRMKFRNKTNSAAAILLARPAYSRMVIDGCRPSLDLAEWKRISAVLPVSNGVGRPRLMTGELSPNCCFSKQKRGRGGRARRCRDCMADHVPGFCRCAASDGLRTGHGRCLLTPGDRR